MLFDLKGRRRRVIQVTYVMLAVLMGGGLVLFGVGSGNGNGGLFDAFTGGSSSDAGSGQVADRVDAAEERLRANPRDQPALVDVVRGRYQLATTRPGAETGTFPPEALDDLRRASDAWQRYLASKPARVDPSLAQLMVNAYGEFGLKRPDQAADAAEVVAEARPTSASYLSLAQYATLAKQKRRADLAGAKALDLASKGERGAVRQQLDALEAFAAQKQAPGGAAGAAAPPAQR